LAFGQLRQAQGEAILKMAEAVANAEVSARGFASAWSGLMKQFSALHGLNAPTKSVHVSLIGTIPVQQLTPSDLAGGVTATSG